MMIVTSPHSCIIRADKCHNYDRISGSVARAIVDNHRDAIGFINHDIDRRKCDANRKKGREIPFRQDLDSFTANNSIELLLDIHSYPKNDTEWGKYDMVLFDIPNYTPKWLISALKTNLISKGYRIRVWKGNVENDIVVPVKRENIPAILIEVNEKFKGREKKVGRDIANCISGKKNSMSISVATQLADRFIYYHTLISSRYYKDTGVQIKRYKRLEREKIIKFFRNFKFLMRNSILDISSKLLSDLIILQALPNTNHRTSWRFINHYLYSNNVRLYPYLEKRKTYNNYGKKSKEILRATDRLKSLSLGSLEASILLERKYREHYKLTREYIKKLAQSGNPDSIPTKSIKDSFSLGDKSVESKNPRYSFFDMDNNYSLNPINNYSTYSTNPSSLKKCKDLFELWHDRAPTEVVTIELPDSKGRKKKLGRILRVDYSSDKWNEKGDKIDYWHPIEKNQPILAIDSNNNYHCLGKQPTTPEGIVECDKRCSVNKTPPRPKQMTKLGQLAKLWIDNNGQGMVICFNDKGKSLVNDINADLDTDRNPFDNTFDDIEIHSQNGQWLLCTDPKGEWLYFIME